MFLGDCRGSHELRHVSSDEVCILRVQLLVIANMKRHNETLSSVYALGSKIAHTIGSQSWTQYIEKENSEIYLVNYT